MAKTTLSQTGTPPTITSSTLTTPIKTAPRTRNRRSPAQLLADLQAERDLITEKMGARLAKLNARIERVEARYDTQIRLAELTTGTSLDELQRQLDEAKHQQKLLRLALKTKG